MDPNVSSIKDELEELIFLTDPCIFISEYIPFGSNHIIAFNYFANQSKFELDW